MPRRIALFLLILMLCLGVTPVSLAAADKGSSEFWVGKLAEYYTQSAPYSLVYAMDMNMTQQGTTLVVRASGDILYAGPEQMRADIDMEMAMDLLPEPMKMSLLMVHDGETIWTEVDNPMSGGKQVMKVAAAAAKELQAQGGAGSGIGTDQLDPAAQVRMLAALADLEVAGISDGAVRLEGEVKEGGTAQLGPASQFFGGEGLGRLVITLDEKTGALRHVTMGDAAQPLLTINYEDIKRVPAGDIPADAFTYTPPEGTTVQDLTEVLRDIQAGTEAGNENNESQEPAPVQ